MIEADGRNAYSYGGGVQSTAMLVLAAQGYLPPGPFLFANVGDDSEHPATLRYVREVAYEFAGAHGIEVHELYRMPTRGRWKGQRLSLRQQLASGATPAIPVRNAVSGAPMARSCTADFKIRVVSRWIKDHGATAREPWTVNIGISTDEYHRATSAPRAAWERPAYPLLTLEHRLATRGANRSDCKRIIADAGLPIPPKSSCFYCPFHRPSVFNDQARDEPDLFEQSCQVEEGINRGRSVPVYLTRFGKPLRSIFGPEGNTQLGLLGSMDEDEGYRCGDVCDT